MSTNALAIRSGRSALVPARAAVYAAASAELPTFVTREEVHRALALLKDRRPEVYTLVLFLWSTGCRVSEALKVRAGMVSSRPAMVGIPTLKQKEATTTRGKKRRGTMRTVPLKADVLGELLHHMHTRKLDDDAPLFPWSRSRAFELVRDALVAAKVDRPRAHPHALRHGWAVHAVMNDVPLNVIQRVLGHSSITTTSIYLAVTGEDARPFIERVEW